MYNYKYLRELIPLNHHNLILKKYNFNHYIPLNHKQFNNNPLNLIYILILQHNQLEVRHKVEALDILKVNVGLLLKDIIAENNNIPI